MNNGFLVYMLTLIKNEEKNPSFHCFVSVYLSHKKRIIFSVPNQVCPVMLRVAESHKILDMHQDEGENTQQTEVI